MRSPCPIHFLMHLPDVQDIGAEYEWSSDDRVPDLRQPVGVGRSTRNTVATGTALPRGTRAKRMAGRARRKAK